MADEFEILDNPDSTPGAVSTGYQRQNTNTEASRNGIDLTTVKQGFAPNSIEIGLNTAADFNSVLYKNQSLSTIATTPGSTEYIQLRKGTTPENATVNIVTDPGNYEPIKNANYDSNGNRILNWRIKTDAFGFIESIRKGEYSPTETKASFNSCSIPTGEIDSLTGTDMTYPAGNFTSGVDTPIIQDTATNSITIFNLSYLYLSTSLVSAITLKNAIISDTGALSKEVFTTGVLKVGPQTTTTTDTVGVGGFTAGVAGVSNPTVETSIVLRFSTADYIYISGANDPDNDGYYEVLSNVGNTVTIRGVGVDPTVESWTKDQFVTDPTATGLITKVINPAAGNIPIGDYYLCTLVPLNTSLMFFYCYELSTGAEQRGYLNDDQLLSYSFTLLTAQADL